MRIALLGYGKMGKKIEELAELRGHTTILKVNNHVTLDKNLTTFQEADVAIEFSQPNAALKNILTCFEHNIPVISGTTGWLSDYDLAVEKCTELKGAMLYASNFSIGVNIFFEVNKFLAKQMNGHPQYKVQVEEIHHTSKKDQPSGTGITLAEGVMAHLDRKNNWVNHSSSESSDLSLVSKRIDQVPGTHQINYDSEIDSIEIKHTAHSRKGFAMGAIEAAEWIVGKEGVFGMRDVLGF